MPALGDHRREHPPAVYGRGINALHSSTINYPLSADPWQTRTREFIYWLAAPGISDSANKCRVYGGHFNQKSALTLSCDRQFAQISMQPSGERQQYFIPIVNQRGTTQLWQVSSIWVKSASRFNTSCRKSHVLSRCRRRERLVVLTSEWRSASCRAFAAKVKFSARVEAD